VKNDSANYMWGDLDFDRPFDMWVLLSRTQYAILRLRELELLPFGISTAQAQVLNILHNAGGKLTLTQISKYTMRRHHSVSNLIIKMAEQGLVEKTKIADSKEFTIAITEKGREQYNTDVNSRIGKIFETLSDKEKQQLIDNLKKVLSTTRDLLGVDYQPPYLSRSGEDKE
jgi:DNA-binding MarR family transcriptional regulator